MKNILKFTATGLLLLALCGCHKNGADATPVVSSELAGCAGSLHRIAGAKEGWARDAHASSNAVPTRDDLEPYFPHGMPKCPAKGTYTIGAVNEWPKCSIAAHNEYFLSLQTNQ
jgi:hypothetical protein